MGRVVRLEVQRWHRLSGTTGYMLVGDVGNHAACAQNIISGTVQVTGSIGGLDFSGNQSSGAITLSTNTDDTYAGSLPPLLVGGNAGSGTLSGTGNGAALTNGGQKNTIAGKSGQFATL